MLPFSVYLRELLKTKRVTVSELARLTGLERTALSKALTGHRVLPYDSLDLLAYHLRLTPGEEARLRSYYDTQFEKEDIRLSRKIIGKLFADFAEMDFFIPAFENTALLLNLEQYAGGRSIFPGAINVQRLLRIVLAEELARSDARIELTVPPAGDFINDELLHRYLGGQMAADVTQIIAFDSSRGGVEDVNLHNLKCFCQVLPACLLSGRRYHPYYYYGDSATVRYTDSFPYFIVTHGSVICLTEDCTKAMLLRKADQVSHYHRHFQTLLVQCRSMVQYTTDPLEILEVYDKCTDQNGVYTVMDQPCFGRFYSDALIECKLRPELPFFDTLSEAAKRRFDKLRKSEHFYTLFTKSGLERAAKTGHLDDFPETLVQAFTVEERRMLLIKLAKAIRSGDVIGRLVGERVFPNYLSMSTSVHSGVGIFTTEKFPLQEGFCSIQIHEPSLCHALHDWLIHLPGDVHTQGAEETVQVLENLSRRL